MHLRTLTNLLIDLPPDLLNEKMRDNEIDLEREKKRATNNFQTSTVNEEKSPDTRRKSPKAKQQQTKKKDESLE